VVADVLAGRPAVPEGIARARANTGRARERASDTAQQLLQKIAGRQPPSGVTYEQLAFELASGLARYLGVDAVAMALMREGRLIVMAASRGSPLSPGADLGELLPPALAIVETGSSLVLPNVPLHPSFGPLSGHLDGIRCFVGVPVLVAKAPVGVLCVIHCNSVDIEPEDLSLIRLFATLSSSVLSSWAQGRPEQDLPTRFGRGIAPRFLFEQMLDSELRLLDHKGGSMELAIVNLTDLGALREALTRASELRMFAGVLSEGRVALYKRSEDRAAASLLEAALEAIRGHAESRAAGVVDLAVTGLAPFAAPELLRIAERALDKTLEEEGGGLQRLVIEDRAVLA